MPETGSRLPPLPKLQGDLDLMLDVYTHNSIKHSTHMNQESDYGDTDRLAELGAKVLDLAVTAHLFQRRPMITADEIRVQSLSFYNCQRLISTRNYLGEPES